MVNQYRINMSKDIVEGSELLDKSKLKAMEYKEYKYCSSIKEGSSS